MTNFVWKVRNTAAADRLYRAARNTLSGPGWGAFHRDRIYQSLMLDLLAAFEFTSFVETGTYRGYSTELIASRFPILPVFTTEVVEATFARSRSFLKKYPNVTCILGSSDEVVKQLLQAEELGDMPLFYLDAHWQHYWPLRKELSAIGAAGGKAVIVIDDFEVPGRPEFGYDIDGGGEVTLGEKCNLDYIRPALVGSQSYEAAFPRYTPQAAFGPTGKGQLRGHIVLFQNLEAKYAAWVERLLARGNYEGVGVVTPGGMGDAGSGHG